MDEKPKLLVNGTEIELVALTINDARDRWGLPSDARLGSFTPESFDHGDEPFEAQVTIEWLGTRLDARMMLQPSAEDKSALEMFPLGTVEWKEHASTS